MDYLAQAVLGIVTGILTTVILFLIKELWVKTIRPYVEEIRYKGVSVAGLWRGYSRDEFHDSDATLFVEQSAQKISGTFSFRFRNPEKQFVLEYQVTGYLWEGYLTLNFRPKDRAITTSAMALLKIAGGGNSLVGQFCFRNVEIEAVTAIHMNLARQHDNVILRTAPLVPPHPAVPPPAPAAPAAPASTSPAPATSAHAQDTLVQDAQLAQNVAGEGRNHG